MKTIKLALTFVWINLVSTTNHDNPLNSSGDFTTYKHYRVQKNYKDEPPVPLDNKGPLIVDVEILVWCVIEVSAQRLDMEVDLYINFGWNDYRIEITNPQGGTITITENADKLWSPYVIFRNCKGCSALDLDPNKNDMFLDLKTGKIMISVRSLSRFICPIDLRAYPMDKQLCKIQLVNYFEDISKIFLNHVYSPRLRKVLSGHILSEYAVADITKGNCTRPIHSGIILSCIEMEVHFERRLGHYVISIYAPTFLIVVLSWIAFWLPPENPPARITLGVTSLLTLATRLDQAQKNLPPVSYVKAIDIWMLACLFLVFSSLIEFAISNSLWRKGSDINKVSVGTVTRITKIAGKEISSTTSKSNEINDIQKWAIRIDIISRIAFPVSFIIFNLIYWSVYQ